jgi:hypothetical protein
MAYQFEFFQRTRDVPAGKTVRRYSADFVDLRSASAHGIAQRENVDRATDGCRIYRDGVYQATLTFLSKSGLASPA